MNKIKNMSKRGKIIIVFALILFLCLFINPISMARYVYNTIKNYYLETQSFYFNCDKLAEDTAIYQIDNWAGVDVFSVTYNMNSMKNNLVVSNSDISYNISYSCSSNIDCTVSKTSGFIPTTTNTDYFTLTFSPNVALREGDSVWMEVSASATEPYTKTISGKITFNVGIPGLAYEIIDESSQPYLNFEVTNTLDFYKVITAFDSYQVGDTMSVSNYQRLSDANKLKCASALIRLDFDPNVVLLDMTSQEYLDSVSHTITTIGGYDYINSVTFRLDAISSTMIRFYKVNAEENYTYPFGTSTPIITFSAT